MTLLMKRSLRRISRLALLIHRYIANTSIQQVSTTSSSPSFRPLQMRKSRFTFTFSSPLPVSFLLLLLLLVSFKKGSLLLLFPSLQFCYLISYKHTSSEPTRACLVATGDPFSSTFLLLVDCVSATIAHFHFYSIFRLVSDQVTRIITIIGASSESSTIKRCHWLATFIINIASTYRLI